VAKQPNVVGQFPVDKLFQSFQPIAAITTTRAGIIALQPLWQVGAVDLWVPETLIQGQGVDAERVDERTVERTVERASIQTYSGSLKAHLTSLWQTHHSFVFCLATGAVVRLIAPLLQDKTTDPAVVVVDATKQYVISLCGGHQARADALTRSIALQLGATPILTGGANGLHLPGVDVFGEPFGWQRGEGDWTGVSAVIAQQRSVQVIQEVGSELWRQGLPEEHPFVWEQGEQAAAIEDQPVGNAEPNLGATVQARLWISPLHRDFSIHSIHSEASKLPQAQWHPKVLWVGIGCERGTSRRLIETAIQQV
jgi:cobalt-precorrin 5A hydrolase/precorrin-3B C17-methyltransferase